MEQDLPEGWEWVLYDVTCPDCSCVSQLHVLPDDWHDTWECPHCGAIHSRGVEPTSEAFSYVLECGHCHGTFDPATVVVTDDGTWTCPTCETVNRSVSAGEHAAGTMRSL